MTIPYDFGNAQNWQPIWESTYVAAQYPNSGGFAPIVPQEVPLFISQPIIAIYCSTETIAQRSTWHTGCWVRLTVPASGVQSSNLQFQSQRALLDLTTVLVWPQIANQYVLRLEIPDWLTDIFVQIWEYIGPINDPILVELETLKVDLARIESKIDAL